MDSLLATYASSDEDEDQQQPRKQNQASQSNFPSQPATKFGGNFLSSLPPPKSQLSNPPPQTLTTSKPKKVAQPQSGFNSSSSASLFSSLPQPKTERSDPFSLGPKPKKVVQFRPPVMSKVVDDDDEDEDDDKEEQTKKDSSIPEAPSVKSFLSSIPAPRNSGSLGALPSSAGMGRRSILESEVPALSNSKVVKDTVNKASDNQIMRAMIIAIMEGMSMRMFKRIIQATAQLLQQYESKWIDRSSGDMQPEISEAAAIQNMTRVPGKRGRNEIPHEIIEVSQDELMKNRPREDQVKSTGIAFGPSYQPASSGKGKPTKLHKRKHQIGSLYFDMRSKEMELAERRSKGFLTKAETQAKYGWANLFYSFTTPNSPLIFLRVLNPRPQGGRVTPGTDELGGCDFDLGFKILVFSSLIEIPITIP
ncbi:unnamed protein product [Lactuca saligna]|uniref:Uncharacterized protein n=1 Tax=Lactuca saligna TaxID=75948 RepID=A0AA35ZYS6_LACSI|nr:unnamed protein product [Lactuca saligna]